MTFITEKRDKLSRGWFVILGAVVVVMIVGVVLAARGALDPPIPSPAPAAGTGTRHQRAAVSTGVPRAHRNRAVVKRKPELLRHLAGN